ncbi:MAG: tryptophan--tRNA ligase [Elusimicrobia bacterium]|nr:tryptophan--tRNA ligase [Elusimicrobiota bacterium]
MKKRVFSGIQPSGIVHLGNYFGALKNWVALQTEHECLYSIVDLHAITVAQEPGELKKNIRTTAALCLAAGVDPKRSILFLQSDVAEHSELAWILNCHAYFGELRRMTQFKDKGGDQESTTVGLYDYPVLMAADILLYGTRGVPVGDDQRQHLELTRTIARRFNGLYGDVFVVPDAIIPEAGARVMALDDPSKKMSKSASSVSSYIALTDTDDAIRAKFKTAVTDSGREIIYDEAGKPAIANLLTIYSLVTDKSVAALQEQYRGQGYAAFKKDLGAAVIAFVAPIRERFNHWIANANQLEGILKEGAEKARALAGPLLGAVKERLGLGLGKQKLIGKY